MASVDWPLGLSALLLCGIGCSLDPECFREDECATGAQCVNHVCIPPDGGLADSGAQVVDTGVIDTGTSTATTCTAYPVSGCPAAERVLNCTTSSASNDCGALLPNGVPDGWVCIPKGSFMMGSPGTEPGREAERQHSVQLSSPILVRKVPVTIAEWNCEMDHQEPGCPQCPVDGKTAYWGPAYANHLTGLHNAIDTNTDKLTVCYVVSERPYGFDDAASNFEPDGLHPTSKAGSTGYRLLTEAEWEYSARANKAEGRWYGSMSHLSGNGDDDVPALDAIGWYKGNTTTVRPVGEKVANDWGLYDMLGNVHEWVDDTFHPDYGAPEVGSLDPHVVGTSTTGEDGVVRGCWYYVGAAKCRLAARQRKPHGDTQGAFRLARTLEAQN